MKVEGLKLPIMQTFVHFSLVFTHFASKTYKTQPWDIFQYFDAYLGVFVCFGSLNDNKMMSIYTLINNLLIFKLEYIILTQLMLYEQKFNTKEENRHHRDRGRSCQLWWI